MLVQLSLQVETELASHDVETIVLAAAADLERAILRSIIEGKQGVRSVSVENVSAANHASSDDAPERHDDFS